MDLITTILLFALAAVPVGLFGGWFAARGNRLGSLVGGGGDSWWRSQMPWPQGVQEADDVKWHFSDVNAAPGARADEVTVTDSEPGAPAIGRTRLRPRIRLK